MASPAQLEAEIRRRSFALPRPHLLSVDDLDRTTAEALIDLADAFADLNRTPRPRLDLLRGKVVANLFFENSTRTRLSFEIAAGRLGAQVVNFETAASSLAKGETLLDTAQTVDAMGVDAMVVRHAEEGAPARLAEAVRAQVVNAGDGRSEHPTQALLDALALRRAFGRLEGLTVAICGDVGHSRVAGSNARLLPMLGVNVRLAAPPDLAGGGWPAGVEVFHDLREALRGADAVMMLRVQRERMDPRLAPSPEAYFHDWGLDREKLKLAAPGAKVMHPGPMNRGVEIESGLADDPEVSLVLTQVEMGVAVRMAVLTALAEGTRQSARGPTP